MELPRRPAADVGLPPGAFTATLERLRQSHDAHDLRIGIFNAFDFRTRMLPYWYADKRMAPCSVRTLADVLHAAGFRHVRVVLQQWAPYVRPSLARLDGAPLDLLLVSAMQVHAEPSYALIRDAHTLGAQRPLIIAGGPKAIYEPADYFELGPQPGVGADCVVTGEAFVLLNLLEQLIAHRRAGERLRPAFERAREDGRLRDVPGLVYLDPAADERPVAVNTGVQRLLQHLDELPMPDAGYRLLEPPHRRRELAPQPLPAHRVARRSPIASLISTQGCKFNCSFCPIPAVNQRTWRHKSPQRLAAEIRHIHESFGITAFFGTDDNFFNRRESVQSLMEELARTRTKSGERLGRCIRFYTEATQFDVHKNRDLLPLCRKAGLRGIWFGIEDISAELINKGQTAAKTRDLFRYMNELGVQPMAMMIHSDHQPLRSAPGTLAGLLNQARFLFDSGAVSYQCTYLGPAIGTRDIEPALESGAVYRRVGGVQVPQAFYDGNHVNSSHHPRPWDRQLNLLRAYSTFYNPFNFLKSLLAIGRERLAPKRAMLQIIGMIGLLFTAPRMLLWARRLKAGPIERYQGLERARIPLIDAHNGAEVDWAVRTVPSLHPDAARPAPAAAPEADEAELLAASA